ncbi:enoyl-CoA hydratase/isomerase family protein [Rhodococcus erythropolis]|uniref:enoyl-CoA hydratase/isomerase family protein n=1 Tax=Rhodococcus erythropolis TaxID=1833 RepID=UPI0024B75170|nr:enoyl-CoA hydratase/isomerase family protein [Rhodococcus erythropolis]MDJ0015511.1 enoyl-CoA hydratase/isomerase family protein [Rhodococcus erythropolis]
MNGNRQAGSEPLVLVDKSEPVWILTINQAHKRNAMGLEERRALIGALRSAEVDDSCRAVVLTGAGPIFCAGGDISAMTADPGAATMRLGVLTELVRALVRNRKPVVAAVEGGAFGLGLSLAAACDYVVAAHGARFVASFGKLGLAADTGLHWSLSQRVGPARAKELILWATELTASEAQRIGLVNDIVEPGQAVAMARERAEAFRDTSPAMVAATKAIFAQPTGDVDAVLAAETTAQLSLLQTEEFRRRQDDFLVKRRQRSTS